MDINDWHVQWCSSAGCGSYLSYVGITEAHMHASVRRADRVWQTSIAFSYSIAFAEKQ